MVYKIIILWNCSLFIYTRQEVLDNEVEVKALKSFIHAESLTSPQHPFYDPKAEGVEMYMGKDHKLERATLSHLGAGTLPDGESRLLFSSKQVEYLRYWIKAMGLVDRLIPLPNSDYLLTREILSTVSPVYFKNAGELKNIQKVNGFMFSGSLPDSDCNRPLRRTIRDSAGPLTGTLLP